jgi:serine/threonine protein kinase
MTILAVALGRYPFVTPKSARSLDHSGEVITEGDGGYWAILQAIQERPSIRSLLSSCQHHCGHRHSHSPAGFQGTSNSASPTDHSTTSPPHFSKAFHSFLSQCLQKDPKQRPSAQTLLQHPFFQSHPVTSFSAPTGDAFALTPASHLTDDFIRHCCASHKENLEAKAISARNRLSHNSLFFNASERELDPLARVSAVATPGGSVAPRSGEKTADNNAHRRRIRKPSVSETFAAGVAVPGAVSSAVVTGEVQNEGVKQLRTVVKAYREYLNRAWGKKIKTGTKGPSPAPTPGTGSSLLNLDITSSQAAERIILATLTPLHSRAVLLHLSDALNVPLSLVNKSFQKIIRELKDHLASASSTAPSSTAHIFTDASLTALLDRGFPSSETNTPPAVDSSTRVSVRQSKESSARPAVTPPQEAEQGQEADSMDRSDGSDTAAVAELRALMNTRSSPVAAGGFDSLQTAVEMLQRTHREDVVAAEDDDQDEERDEDAALSPERPLPEDLYEFWSERGAQQGEQEQEAGDLYGQGDVEDEGILSSALPLSPLNPRSVSPWDDGHGGEEEQAGEGEEGEEEEDYDDDFEEEHE